MSLVRRALVSAGMNLRAARDGYRYAKSLPPVQAAASSAAPSQLEQYFDANLDGPGIWKWRHYFAIYHRHLDRFVGREVHMVEIGVAGGGSLAMWQHYLGDRCHLYGVDIAEECRVYERERVRIFIGDQADPSFWARFVAEVPRIDVVLDDGGHRADQQITTLKALLPHLAPGGVYLCEDIAGKLPGFRTFVDALTRPLNAIPFAPDEQHPPLPLHQHVGSVHHYPLLTVLEKPAGAVRPFESVRRGTEWRGVGVPREPQLTERA